MGALAMQNSRKRLMTWKKLDYVNAAYEELGLANYIFDLEPEQLQTAVNKLDNLMLEWDSRGIKLGYPFASNPSIDTINEETNLPPQANNAIICNLAVRLAPSVGKTPSIDTKVSAYQGLQSLFAQIPVPQMTRPTGIPAGAGNKAVSYPDLVYLPTGDDRPIGVDNQNLTLKGS